MHTLKTSQKLGNYLANFAREIREAGGYTSIDRGFLAVSLDPAQYEHYHLIILDDDKPYDYYGNRLIKPSPKAFCRSNVVVFTDISEKAQYISEVEGVLYLSKYLGDSNIVSIIMYLLSAEKTKHHLSRYVSRVMTAIGIKPHYVGSKYIKTAVQFAFEDTSLLHRSTMRLYELVADYYDTDTSSVEHAIRNAIDCAYRSSPEKLSGFLEINRRPRSSELISALASSIMVYKE